MKRFHMDQGEEAWVEDEGVMARAYTIFLRMKDTLDALIAERDAEDTMNDREEIYP